MPDIETVVPVARMEMYWYYSAGVPLQMHLKNHLRSNPDKMIQTGVDVVRLNFSHQTTEIHQRRLELVRSCANAYGRTIGVIAD